MEHFCFSHDPVDVGNLISGSSAFSKTSLNIWKFMFHIFLNPGLKNFEHYFTSREWSEILKTWMEDFPPHKAKEHPKMWQSGLWEGEARRLKWMSLWGGRKINKMMSQCGAVGWRKCFNKERSLCWMLLMSKVRLLQHYHILRPFEIVDGSAIPVNYQIAQTTL